MSLINRNADHFIWCEKYRPKVINECILPTRLLDTLRGFVDKKELQNLLFTGPAGTGKTTAALALCNEIGADVLFINASMESGIDVLRSKIAQFASTVSLTSSGKMVILDEADYANPQSFQPALRGFMEEFSDNCRFILTCNYKNRIIEPLHSRCAVIDFKTSGKEKPEIAAKFFKRIQTILKIENVEFDSKVVAEIVQKFFPDFRRILNELQRYSASGNIDSAILSGLTNESYKQLFNFLRDKNFTEVRKWIAIHNDGDATRIFRELYSNCNGYLDQSSIPQLILILADYQHRAAFVADHEINLAACCVEIMSGCKFI